MTKTYHDVEAVTRLLEEKEKDLELAAHIGQELLERNRFLEEKVFQLETHVAHNNELITQLRHDLQVKTDLLRVYDADAAALDEASPLEIRNVSIDLLQRKIHDMEVENKKLHEEATELAKEAIEVEEKEEKLVYEAVKHLSDANVKISNLSEEFTCKLDESRKQKEEITHLLAKVCDLTSRVRVYSKDNEELRSSLCAYKETQEELTSELSDFKEKYREIVDLLHDARDELKKSRKRQYPGMGQHSLPGMFVPPAEAEDLGDDGTQESSLLSEIHSSLRSSKRTSKKASRQSSKLDSASDFSDSDIEARKGYSAFSGTFNTFRYGTINSKMVHGGSSDSPVPVTQGYNPGQGSSLDKDYHLEAYSRPSEAHAEDAGGGDRDHRFQLGGLTASSTNNTLTSAGSFGHLGTLGSVPGRKATLPWEADDDDDDPDFGTVGQLTLPQMTMEALASPLGTVPSQPRTDQPRLDRLDLGSVPPFIPMGGPAPGSLGSLPLGTVPTFPDGRGFCSLPGIAPVEDDDLTLTSTHRISLNRDSGVTSSDFSEVQGFQISQIGDRADHPGDGMSDDGGLRAEECKGGEFPGVSALDSNLGTDIGAALRKLKPEDVEHRRRQLGRTYSYDLGSDGFDSPGSSIFGRPGFNFLPYGVRTPDSIMSTGSRDWLGSAIGGPSYYGAGWKLPDKLRIVKPLEGSLTLNNWSRLAKPHLGNILEERDGVAMRGTLPFALRNVEEESSFKFQEFDDEDEDNLDEASELPQMQLRPDTLTRDTITDCTVLHPDESLAQTLLTSSYGGLHMSSGFGEGSLSSTAYSSRCSSRMSSRRQSVSETGWRRSGTLTFSSNIGLARVLNERQISGYLSDSTLSLDQSGLYSSDVSGMCSLTPSVISTPAGIRSFSPTGTPLNSPTHTPPGTPPNEPQAESGFVLGFFASLRSALYGEQQKEVHTIRHQRKKEQFKKFGILERVEEVGVENLLSSSPAPPYLSGGSRDSSLSREDSLSRTISDFDHRFLSGNSGESIAPPPPLGAIPRNTKARLKGQREATPEPILDKYGGFNPYELSCVQGATKTTSTPHHTTVTGGRGPGRILYSPGGSRPDGMLLPGLGVPGQPGTGALLQTPKVRTDLGLVPVTTGVGPERRHEGSGFMGNITSMFFGRKGGLL